VRRRPPEVSENAVFINVPYDEAYEPIFIALFTAILAVGRTPHCVLELPDGGEGRLERLLTMIETCRVSFHDLCREGTPARHNMPFEFGLTYARREYLGKHDCFILEERPNRTLRTFSDGRKFEPLAHRGRPCDAVNCVLDALGRPSKIPNPVIVEAMRRKLSDVAQRVKRTYRRRTLFHRAPYIEFRNAALVLAAHAGFYNS
jgi:hypothetical protein